MTDRFEDLGISPELVAGIESLGWDGPGGLQTGALPVIRRGNNVVLHASAGSGAVGAYGLGILDRLIEADDETGSPRALVLVPDADAASLTAGSLARLAGPAGLTVRAADAGWAARPVDVLVLTPSAATAAVRDSALKLEGVLTVVVDGADLLHATGQWDDLETMVDIVPPGSQRVVVTGRLGAPVDGFVERHVRKALTVPPRATDEDADVPTGGVPVRYRVVPEPGKAAAVAELASAVADGEVAVIARSQDRADTLERELDARGITAIPEADGDEDAGESLRILVLPRGEADQRTTRAEVISADVPMDAEAMAELHGRGGAVLVTPREREHLFRIARRAGIALKPVPDPAPAARNPAEIVRDRVREILEAGDLAADLALVEPLLDTYPAAEVAAAALHLARSAPSAGAGATRSEPSAGTAAVGKRPGAGAPPPTGATTWTHLFVSIGSRDDVGPGDLMGAVTGEAGVAGDQVGKIDIRESHTTLEVATGVADQVIKALNGRTIKGRSLRVDYDRKARSPRKPSGGRGGGRRPSGGGGRGGSRGPSGGGRPPRRS